MRSFFYFLFILVFSVFAYFSVKTINEFHSYLHLSKKTYASLVSKQVRGDKKFYVEGVFLLPDGQSVKVDMKGPFLNRYVAEEEIGAIKLDDYVIWTDGKQGVLKRPFPLKSLFSTLLLAGVLGYFAFLKKRCNV